MLKQFPPKGTFYDVGGGNGFVSKRLVENGIETALLEPGKNGVFNAKKRGLKNIICSTLENAGFKHDILPAVGLFDVVEHIEDDRKFLKLVFDLLEPEGRLYITAPAFHLLWSKEDDAAGHFKRYTISSIGKILDEIGFAVEYATYIFSILLMPIFLFRSLPGKLRIIKNSNFNEKHRQEHSEKGGITGKVLEKSFRIELARIKNKKKIPFGTSCLIAAIRPGSAKSGRT
jgi:2-polyprenyl-3-methyl-5-hydroxy-6-metoxy-1,4-benzoquinol methylase